MFDFWDSELSEEETQRLLDKAANEVKRRRLEAPAILALEMHRPLAYIGAHAAVTLAPFIAPITGFDRYHDYTRLLSKRENIERLIRLIETKPEESKERTMEEPC